MWKEENNTLKRTLEFKDFTEAFGFMAKVAIVAEKWDIIQIGQMFTIKLALN